MRIKGAWLLAAAWGVIAPLAARGDLTVTTQFTGVSPGQGVTVYSTSPYVLGGTGTYKSVLAGGYKHNLVPEYQEVSDYYFFDSTNPITLFCIDVGQWVAQGVVEFDLVDPSLAPQPHGSVTSGPMGAERAAWLGVLAASDYWNTDLGGYLDETKPEAERNRNYAAMQVAIWEIVFEDNLGNWDVTYAGATPTNGAFYIGGDARPPTETGKDPTVAYLANEILKAITQTVNTAGGVFSADREHLGALVHDTYQDMLVITQHQVPEPTSMVLAALGLLGLVSRRRRRD